MRLYPLLCCVISFFNLSAQDTDSAVLEKKRLRWNHSLTEDTTYHFRKLPNELLVKTAGKLKPGAALDIGMGQGRNTIYLAKNGWKVTGIDIADEAISVAKNEAKTQHLKIETVLTSMDKYDFGINRWDLITFVYEGCFDSPDIIKKMKASMKSGATLVFEFFHREAGIEMKRPDFGCTTNLVRDALKKEGGFDILLYEEKPGIADYGLEEYKLVKMVAKKK